MSLSALGEASLSARAAGRRCESNEGKVGAVRSVAAAGRGGNLTYRCMQYMQCR